MKCEIIIDPACEEKAIIYARENSRQLEAIKKLVEESGTELVGYGEKGIKVLNPADIYCVTVLDGKVYAVCKTENLLLKQRLYEVEEKLSETFVKINQSCLANLRKVERFDASVSGTLMLRFQNGYTDYVSRRQLKQIKERLGIK